MRTLFFVIAALTVSLVNMNCIWPPIRTLNKGIKVALTTSLSLGEYLREGPCQYTCKESGGCNTQLVVDWANVTQKWCGIRIHNTYHMYIVLLHIDGRNFCFQECSYRGRLCLLCK